MAPPANMAIPSEKTDSSVYKNDPIVGGEQEIILNDIIIRSPVRIEYEIDNWRSALQAAEMRYFPNRTRLYDIYEDIKLDGHLFGVMTKRIHSVINQQIIYQAADGEEVEAMNAFIKCTQFDNIKRIIMETRFWGISGFEFLPGSDINFRMIPRKHIKPKTQIISIEQNDQTEGFDYTRLDNVWVLGEPEDLGVLNQCCQYVLYKRGAMGDWANFIEIFGMPVRVIKYDPFDALAEAKLKKMVDESGNLMAVMIPNTAQFEIMDGKTSNATGDLQASFIQACNQELSIIILGNTETTTNSGTGTGSKSKVHSEQQKELLKSDIVYLENYLNDPHFSRILAGYGAPVSTGGRFNVKSELDVDYLIQKVHIDTTLAAAGLPIGTDYFYEEYDIPKPAPNAPILQPKKKEKEK
jgi:hypothetical protein